MMMFRRLSSVFTGTVFVFFPIGWAGLIINFSRYVCHCVNNTSRFTFCSNKLSWLKLQVQLHNESLVRKTRSVFRRLQINHNMLDIKPLPISFDELIKKYIDSPCMKQIWAVMRFFPDNWYFFYDGVHRLFKLS